MRSVLRFDVRTLGKHMPRTRYQRGSLRTTIPAHGDRPERRLPRGEFWCSWYAYVAMPDGTEVRRKREKIIDREFAATHRIATDTFGPLTKADAQRVLDLLIAQDAGKYTAPNAALTLDALAREYLALAEPNWGPREIPVARSVVMRHIAGGPLGKKPVADVTDIDLQLWLNDHITSGASKSKLKKLLRHTRAILRLARQKKIVVDDPSESLRAKSKAIGSERYLAENECRQLLSVLNGRDHLIVRLFIQLGLRPEELFALRYDDVNGDLLRVDEALVNGKIAAVKTEASKASVYIPPEVALELSTWIHSNAGQPTDWLFQTTHGRRGFLNPNNYRNRILQPAAIKAGVCVTDTGTKDSKGEPVLKTGVNFQVLRRTCATLFGSKAKDPKNTQTQLRHADPGVTLRYYQKSIPADVRMAADELERDLAFGIPDLPTTVN